MVHEPRAPNTDESRRSALRAYTWFCYQHRLLVLTPYHSHTHRLPDSEPIVLAYFLCYLYIANYSLGTIKQYRGAVRTFYVERKLPGPTIDPTTYLSAVEPLTAMRAIKRKLRGQGRARFPVTRSMMQRAGALLTFCPTALSPTPGPLLNVNVRAAMTLAWFGLLRCAELTVSTEKFQSSRHVARSHVSFLPSIENPEMIEVVIPDAKVDPDPLVRQGFLLRLHRTGTDLCPVQAMVDLFRADPSTDLNRPLFDFRTVAERAALAPPRPARKRFAKHVSQVLAAAGFDDTVDGKRVITTHSFRCGGAMALAQAQVATHVIQLAGRWRSSAHMFYITQPVETLRRLTARMVQAPCSSGEEWGYCPPQGAD